MANIHMGTVIDGITESSKGKKAAPVFVEQAKSGYAATAAVADMFDGLQPRPHPMQAQFNHIEAYHQPHASYGSGLTSQSKAESPPRSLVAFEQQMRVRPFAALSRHDHDFQASKIVMRGFWVHQYHRWTQNSDLAILLSMLDREPSLCQWIIHGSMLEIKLRKKSGIICSHFRYQKMRRTIIKKFRTMIIVSSQQRTRCGLGIARLAAQLGAAGVEVVIWAFGGDCR